MFPDGTEFAEVPVFNWDMIADLAVLGPIETTLQPLALIGGEELVVGSDTYLIGYPGEDEEFPAPTITRGLISRLREWEPLGMTYFQTDATIAGGQSGGALVSEMGDVIGVSGFRFTEGGFGLVGSSTDVLPRIEAMIDGEDYSEVGSRKLPTIGGRTSNEGEYSYRWIIQMYILNEPIDTEVDLNLSGEGDNFFLVFGPYGSQVSLENVEFSSLNVSGSFTVELEGPHFVIPLLLEEEFKLTSNRKLIPFRDIDDDKDIEFGQSVAGSLDHPFDFDYFNIELAEGDEIEILVDSLNVDPRVVIAFPGSTDEEEKYDDDSGEGIFGTNAKLEYTAPHSGSFVVIVIDSFLTETGGYFLSVEMPEAESQEQAYAESLVESANTKDSLDKPDEVIEMYTRAIELAPEYGEAYLRRGNAYFRGLGDLEEALADVIMAVELDPENTNFRNRSAFMYWNNGDYELALVELIAAKDIDEDYVQAYNMTALVLASRGDIEEAIAEAKEGLDIRRRDSASIRDTLAYLYLKNGEFKRALDEYKTLDREGFDHAYLNLGIGIAYAKLDELEKASDRIEEGIRQIEDLVLLDPQLADLLAMAEQELDLL